MTAAAYARFSSDNQREESIDAQLRAIEKYAQSENISIVKTYVDYAISGSTDERGQFQQMFADASKKLFDCVIVHKLDRFSRDLRDTLNYEYELQKIGVKLVSVVEPTDDSASGFLMRGMKGVLNHFYLLNLAEEVKKGQMENAYNCLHNGGQPPYGFDVGDDKKLIINEREAEAVRMMFKLYAEGKGYRTICKELNEKGFRTKRGNIFKHTTIYDMLRNEKYRGVYVFNRCSNHSNNHDNNDEKDIIRIEGGVPAIIDNGLWIKASKRAKKRTGGMNKAKRVFLLSGIIECGECSSAMVGHSSHNQRGFPYLSYRCNSKRVDKTCTLPGISKLIIEEIVINELKENVFSDEAMDRLANELISKIEAEQTGSDYAIKSIKSDIKEKENKIKNIVDAVADGWAEEAMKSKLKALQQERTHYLLKLKEIELAAKSNAPSKNDVIAFIKRQKLMLDGTEEEKQKVIQTFVEKVIIYDDRTMKIKTVLDITGRDLSPPLIKIGHKNVLFSVKF